MPRPPAASQNAIVDADACARLGSELTRRFTAADLPRLSEAGAGAGFEIEASLGFSLLEGQPAIEGSLKGTVMLTCQRCLEAVSIELDEPFRVIVVAEERADEPAGFEPVIAEAQRLDLRWLVEEQALLALPLVARHESEQQCAVGAGASAGSEEESEAPKQQPFRNLRDMLNRR
ncbi:MAG TPA: DUF177 domain-containing protein [Steroidobacter sp.]